MSSSASISHLMARDLSSLRGEITCDLTIKPLTKIAPRRLLLQQRDRSLETKMSLPYAFLSLHLHLYMWLVCEKVWHIKSAIRSPGKKPQDY